MGLSGALQPPVRQNSSHDDSVALDSYWRRLSSSAADAPFCASVSLSWGRLDAPARRLKTCTAEIFIQNECAHVGLSVHAPGAEPSSEMLASESLPPAALKTGEAAVPPEV